MPQTLQYLSTQWSAAQQNLISDLINASGILRTASVGYANNGLFHKYNKVVSLPTASIRDINGTVIPTTNTYDLLQLDLKEIITIEQVDSTLADNDKGGAEAYFMKQKAGHLESLSQSAEIGIVYGTNPTFGATNGFKGFHQLAYEQAAAKGVTEKNMGGSSGATSSMFAATWKPESCQLVIPEYVETGGDLILVTVLNNGQKRLLTVNTTTGAVRPVYEVMYQMLTALQASTNYSIARIHSIDSSHVPTATDIDRMLDQVRADNNTVLYMNRNTKTEIQTLKGTKFFTQADTNMNTVLEFWNSIPIVVSDNIKSTESDALDAG